MKIIKPEKEILIVWRITASFMLFVPAVALFLFVKGKALVFSVALWAILFLFLFLIYIPIYYKNLLFIISDDRTTVKQGVFFIRNQTIHNKDIQFTSIRKSPILRLFGLVSLIIVVSGARLQLYGLGNKQARELIHILEGEVELVE